MIVMGLLASLVYQLMDIMLVSVFPSQRLGLLAICPRSEQVILDATARQSQ